MILIFVLYFFILWFLWDWYNFLFIRQRNFHTVGAITACWIVFGIISSRFVNINIIEYMDVVYLSFVALTIKWWFEILLNLMLGLPWYFQGTTTAMDGNTKSKNKIILFIVNWYRRSQFMIKCIFLFISLCICLAYSGIGVY